MATPERVVILRAIQGIDRSPDARISDEGSWYATINLWSKSTSGLLAKRPGCSTIIDGRAVLTLSPAGGSNPPPGQIQVPGRGTQISVTVASAAPGTTAVNVMETSALAAPTTSFTDVTKGTRGMVPKVNQ